jgi:catechol 2,3-dioxygenase-like lactoylglutathione lyase family enzyme
MLNTSSEKELYMVKKRIGDSWIPAAEYGQSLNGLGINLLVEDIDRALGFQKIVLGAEVVYADPDFAVVRGYGSSWMLHADHTYSDHPLAGSLKPDLPRGVGIELRLHGCDPDQAEAKARARNDIVLAGSMDKPHGLREAYLIDPDGYLWVPDVPVVAKR